MLKKTLCVVALASVCQLSNASGIPTVDVAGIAQMVVNNTARANEFAQNLAEAQKRVQQMKDQYTHYKSMVEGHTSFEDVLSSTTANSDFVLNNWEDIYNDKSQIEQLRDKFNMKSDDPVIQASYDEELLNYQAQQNYYSGAKARNDRMQNLLTQFSTATTPAKKADLANAINFEQVQIQNDAQVMATMNQLMKDRQKLEVDRIARENINNSMRRGLHYLKDEK